MSETERDPARAPGPEDGPPGKQPTGLRGVLLINLGTPASPTVSDVRRYLREFLWDPRVIDLPAVARWLFLHLIVLPFRPRRSAAAYRKIWTDRGSPLLFHGTDLAAKVGRALAAPVELGMRYQEPSIAAALRNLAARTLDRIVVLPLFPQYSGAAWASAVEKLNVEARKLPNLPPVDVVPPFYGAPPFMDALAATTVPHLAMFEPDKVLMSFHGLPFALAGAATAKLAHCEDIFYQQALLNELCTLNRGRSETCIDWFASEEGQGF